MFSSVSDLLITSIFIREIPYLTQGDLFFICGAGTLPLVVLFPPDTWHSTLLHNHSPIFVSSVAMRILFCRRWRNFASKV